MIRDEELLDRIKQYVRLRDAAVIAAVRDGNIELLKNLAEKADAPLPNDKVIEISAHKMCVEITTMPEDLRQKSRQWLRERGYTEGINL